MPKKVFILSFGCQMNKLDTALVAAALKKAGFALTDSIKEADTVLINTCSVRQHAEQRVLSHLGHLQHIKETRPEITVAVIGCMAQRLGTQLLDYKAVDIVCGPAQIPQIAELLTEVLQSKGKFAAVTERIRQVNPENPALENFETVYSSGDSQLPSQGYVRVMRGCDKFCSYCIVPYVRGPEVSRPVGAIIEQIKRLAGEGVKQVTLLGQTVNSYQYSSSGKRYCLADLLRMVSEIDGIEWIRFITSYPAEKYYNELLQAMAALPKVCKYLHMPAQSGSDKILKAMNRNYTAKQYLEMLERARETVPGIALASDFIVGFPGETEEDFKKTVNLVKKARYKNCFVFKYSARPGTIGEKKLEDDIPTEVKKRRNSELLAVQEKISGQLSREFLGKEVKVLIEGASKKAHLGAEKGGNEVQLVGRTAEDWIVVFNGQQRLAGEFAKVKIIKTSPLTLFGELV